MHSRQHWQRSFAAATAVALVSACTPDDAVTPVSPALRAPTQLSSSVSANAGTPTTRHVFLMNSDAPAGFAADVAAAGGSVSYSFAEIGVVVTDGLRDADARALAQGNGKVERDVMLQWVPALPDAGSTVVEYSPPADAEAHNPSTAAFFATNQWNMRQIQAHLAWTAGAQAPGVRVAILDTGLDDRHLDQAGLIDVAASIAFTPSISPVPGPTWRDDQYHGTHVGSIVVANGIGVSGVAPHAVLIAVKVLNASGNGTFGDIIAGIIHATNVGADVINMSLGATAPKAGGLGPLVAALNRAVNYAHANDVVVVSSAGNENEDLQHNESRIKIPCESGVGMCISATGPTQAKASYSNFGSSAIHVAAPGGDFGVPTSQNYVLGPCSTYSVAIVACRRPNPTDPYRYVSVIGTSQAAPHVSGVAALLRARGYQQASQIITSIEDTSDDLGKPGTDQFYGRGRINALRAWTEK